MQIPIRGITLNKNHHLARGLFGLWLTNEGTGNRIEDISCNGRHGDFNIGTAEPVWAAGKKLGSAVSFDGNDRIAATNNLKTMSANCSLMVWASCNTSTPNYECPLNYRTGNNSDLIGIYFRSSTRIIHWWCGGSSGNNTGNNVWTIGKMHCFIITRNSANQGKLYIDGKLIQTVSGKTWSPSGTTFRLWWGYYAGGGLTPLNGHVGLSALWDNKTLSESEVKELSREPFCMLNVSGRPYLTSSQVVYLSGTIAGVSSLTATAKATKKLTGNIAGSSTLNGGLVIESESPPETETTRPTDALFNGMTANAYKLGTALTMGWFWTRTNGCSVLYRSNSMEEIDFANILAVTGPDDCEISPPGYISHSSKTTYFYLVRRFNSCGYQEYTLAAAVKVSIDSNGELTEPKPNKVFDSICGFVDGDKIRLIWYYCPIRQDSAPVRFNVYYDNRTGQVDYQNPLAQIDYKGRKFYSFQSGALEAGRYLFAIKAEDADGYENISLAQLKIQLNPKVPNSINILSVKAV